MVRISRRSSLDKVCRDNPPLECSVYLDELQVCVRMRMFAGMRVCVRVRRTARTSSCRGSDTTHGYTKEIQETKIRINGRVRARSISNKTLSGPLEASYKTAGGRFT
jgi:hypothetical protein